MTNKELLDAVRIAAGVPADGWGAAWNPVDNDSHCAALIVAHRVHVGWHVDRCATGIQGKTPTYSEPIANAPCAALRRAVCRAVIGGTA